MATKEVMVSAPLVVFLYDRTFLAGSFREAWRRRWRYYLALAATWLLLAWLVAQTGLLVWSYRERGENIHAFTWWVYLATQPGVIAHYLRQAFWPSGLCLDYTWPAVATVGGVLFPAIPVVGLLGLTAWALVKRPAWGFLGAWFFLILAPTSSFLPVQGAAAFEHRMYLPLAAVVSGVVAAACLAGKWLEQRGTIPAAALRAVGLCMTASGGIALATVTFQRNIDYQSDLSIWQDTVDKAPYNARAHNDLGLALHGRGRFDEAIAQYRKALEIKPDSAEVHNNLGNGLFGRGQVDEAIIEYQKAMRIRPDYAEAHYNLGNGLLGRGQVDQAITHYRRALEIKPDYVEAHYNLGNGLLARGQFDEAIIEYQNALEIKPDYAEAHCNLGAALAGRGQFDKAIIEYRKALEINADSASAHNNLATALADRGNVDEAREHYGKALRLASDRGDKALVESIRARVRLLRSSTPVGRTP